MEQKTVRLKEVVESLKQTDIVDVVNATDLRENKQQIRVYHSGTILALQSRPDYVGMSGRLVIDIMKLKGDNNKHKTVLSIDM